MLLILLFAETYVLTGAGLETESNNKMGEVVVASRPLLTHAKISSIFEVGNEARTHSSGASAPSSSSRPHAAPAEVCIAIR